MIEKEEWMSRHKNDEKAWKAFKQYCLNCGFKSGKRNGREVISTVIIQEKSMRIIILMITMLHMILTGYLKFLSEVRHDANYTLCQI